MGQGKKVKVGEDIAMNKGKGTTGEANPKEKARPRPASSSRTRDRAPKGPIVIGAELECNRTTPRAPRPGARGAPAGLDTLNFARKYDATG